MDLGRREKHTDALADFYEYAKVENALCIDRVSVYGTLVGAAVRAGRAGIRIFERGEIGGVGARRCAHRSVRGASSISCQ